MIKDKFIKLPSKGRLLIVTDLHGNLEDYEKYIDLWDCYDPNYHIVFVGDFIHSIDENDYSIEIIEDVIDKFKKYPNFHPLLGNHVIYIRRSKATFTYKQSHICKKTYSNI